MKRYESRILKRIMVSGAFCFFIAFPMSSWAYRTPTPTNTPSETPSETVTPTGTNTPTDSPTKTPTQTITCGWEVTWTPRTPPTIVPPTETPPNCPAFEAPHSVWTPAPGINVRFTPTGTQLATCTPTRPPIHTPTMSVIPVCSLLDLSCDDCVDYDWVVSCTESYCDKAIHRWTLVSDGMCTEPEGYPRWECSGGAFVGQMGENRNVGTSVKWKSPAEPGAYTIRLIANDVPGGMYSLVPNGVVAGRRDDPETEVDSVVLTVVSAELTSIRFTSDHQSMNDNNRDWDSSGNPYSQPEWVRETEVNNPISHTKGCSIEATVVVKVCPAGLTFHLAGVGPEWLSFSSQGNVSTGQDQPLTLTAAETLPDLVATLEQPITWTTTVSGTEIHLWDSGPHKIYVTYGTPSGSTVTERRIEKTCEWADTATGEEEVADGIHDNLGNADPPYEPSEKPSEGSGWTLLEGNAYGECDEQADLMRYAVLMQGVTPAYLRFVRASTNAGAGNCLDYETRVCSLHGQEWLLLDFGGAGYHGDMNQFEGCCETANHYYAVWPKEKSQDDYTMLQTLGSSGTTQHWCYFEPVFNWFMPCNQPGATPPIP